MELEQLYDKNILIIVPHQDDEINLAGSLICSLANKANIYVLYTTRGDFIFDHSIRRKEAIKACSKLGVKENHIIFLDYPDQPYDGKTHMYNTEGYWTDKHGEKYSTKDLVNDIKQTIRQLKPDAIFCIDLDFHPDHIMTSLCTEKAIGEILKEENKYYPDIYKGFAYENAFYGPKDFNSKYEKPTYINYDKNNTSISNPYYTKEESIQIIPDTTAKTRKLQCNIVYKAIKKHKSQALAEKAFSIINPDILYWKRETKNLLYNSSISVSSGEASYLNDFLINDTSDVLNGNKKKIIYDKSIWVPDSNDTKKTIHILFKDRQSFEVIKLYHGNNGKNDISEIEIAINGKKYKPVKNHKISILNFDKCISAKEVSIRILDKNPVNGFSEIEIIPSISSHHYNRKTTFTNNAKQISTLRQILNVVINKIDIINIKIYRKIFIKKKTY